MRKFLFNFFRYSFFRPLHCDYWGSRLALLCSLHCLLFPIIFLLLPFSIELIPFHESFEGFLLISGIIFASLSIYHSYYYKYTHWLVLLGFMIACILLSSSYFWHSDSVHFISASGGLLLFGSHLLNRQLARCSI